MAKTKRKLFVEVLDMWMSTELLNIGEFSMNIKKEVKETKEKYRKLLDEYDKLEESYG